ncbi:MAG: Flp pilus assembly complex ATPase component TadA [Desulfobacterales bacterium]|nr:Flp pilus assembly complex ATPase component TadA [Desulfobacterales bacterium]
MSPTTAGSSSEVELKLKEAETCYSMGMAEEALKLYENVIASSDSLPSQTRQTLSEKVKRLKREIKEQQSTERQGLSPEEISLFRKTLACQEDIPALLDGAAALKELGLMEEAVAEYEKLLALDHSSCDYSRSDYSPAKIISDYLACLLEVAQPDEVVKKAYKIIYRHNLKETEAAGLKSWLGRHMESRDQTELAFDLYKTAVEMNPGDDEAAARLEALKGKLGNTSRYDYLLRGKIVSTQQLQEALSIAKRINRSVEFVLVDRFKIDIKEVGRSLSSFYGCPFRQFDPEVPVPFELITNLKKSFLLYYVWVPLKWDKTGIEILVDDPKDLRKTDHIRALMGNQKITFAVALKEDVEKYIQLFFDPRAERQAEKTIDNIDEIIPDVSFEEEVEIHEDASLDESSSQVVKFVDQILVTAFRNGASDIHIEPSAITRKTTIRFRNDGVCYEYIQVPNSMAPAIISRLKIMSELDIAEKRLPQDGKIKMRRKGLQEFELRISTMPTTGKYEDAVLRILTRTGTIRLDDIGLSERNLSLLKKLIAKPYGMLLCVGPTGSGKTTTLHAALAQINQPGVKIWTAEDPVEITQAGLRQVQVRPKIGLDFARVMRGFLRLDPDIIMIGEMRDKETASIALEAALTGHLVLSTLHTNNAPETLTRLVEMGMSPLNISDAFLGVLGQRLVRRLCQACSESYHPGEEEFEDLGMDYGREAFSAAGYTYSPGFTLRRASGCEKCNGSGFKGRIGIHELMEATHAIKLLIKKGATSFDLARQAAQDGMTTLKQDGIQKITAGITNIREVRRVCVE